jgi:hypothetical protein
MEIRKLKLENSEENPAASTELTLEIGRTRRNSRSLRAAGVTAYGKEC